MASAGPSNLDRAQRAAAECKQAVKGYTDGFPDLAPPIAAPEIAALLQRQQGRQGGQEGQAQAVVLVDVRTEGEMAVSMLPGALKKAEFEARMDEFRAKQQQDMCLVVPYCTMGHRSGLYGRKLVKEFGFDKDRVRNGEGIVPWTHDMVGGTLITRQPKAGDGAGYEEVPTRRVHTFGQAWSHFPAEGFEAVYYPPTNPLAKCWTALFGGRKR